MVEYNMKTVNLNQQLIKQQKLSKYDIEQLYIAYDELDILLSNECQLSDKELPDAITRQEYKLQKLWRFTPNSDFHRYWYMTPRCSCPKLDNDDLIGSKHRWFSGGCKLHGGKNNEK